MFRGINAVNIDDKGRLAMPARYRERLQEESENQIVITIDTDATCLLLYAISEWEVIERKVEALPSFNRAARRIQRLLIGHATDVEIDSHGRFLIPPLLREYAAIEKRVMLIGQGKKFEIWSESNWTRERDACLAESQGEGELPPELLTLSL